MRPLLLLVLVLLAGCQTAPRSGAAWLEDYRAAIRTQDREALRPLLSRQTLYLYGTEPFLEGEIPFQDWTLVEEYREGERIFCVMRKPDGSEETLELRIIEGRARLDVTSMRTREALPAR